MAVQQRLSDSAALVCLLMAVLMAISQIGSCSARPLQLGAASELALQLYKTPICRGTGLVCEAGMEAFTFDGAAAESSSATGASAIRDMSIRTVNDLQRDFFLEPALVKGATMALDSNLHDPIPKRAFLTAPAAARLVPALTTGNLPALLDRYNVGASTKTASMMATTAFLCSSPALPGESRRCPASVEALGKFVTSQLGRHVELLATSAAPTTAPAVKGPVTVLSVEKGSLRQGEKIVVCHNVMFPSQVYYCHTVTGTKVVKALLKAVDGSLINAVAICHLDTSLWASSHPAFGALNIPRGAEACHFTVQNDLVWVPSTLENDHDVEAQVA